MTGLSSSPVDPVTFIYGRLGLELSGEDRSHVAAVMGYVRQFEDAEVALVSLFTTLLELDAGRIRLLAGSTEAAVRFTQETAMYSAIEDLLPPDGVAE